MRLPLHIELAGKRVVCIGAGQVGSRRIAQFVSAGAEVVVIAPVVASSVRELAERGLVEWHARSFDIADVAHAWLVHIATDDATVNAAAAAAAEAFGIWSVRADSAEESRAHVPAEIRSADALISIATGDPGRSKRMAAKIEAGLTDGSLDAHSRRPKQRGSVVLIGGGPGDEGLITVAGRRALLTADVVVHDRLAPVGLLALLDDDVEVIDAGKRPDHHTLTQDEINAVIVDRALRGKRVARLKGGDSFVFGRGSEEMLACLEAGVAVEVIPGVTSAIAAPAVAGIPVTHRGTSTGFVVVSGHEVGDLRAVSETGLTVVVLMGVGHLTELVSQFGDRDPRTPVAIVERAFDPTQRTTRGTLATIVDAAAAAQVSNPAVIVIGDAVDVLQPQSVPGGAR